jgi:ATP-dependent exoDNAse (exonuclease V) beta subunit
MPALPAAPAVTTIGPDPAALRTYQEWESRLRATLTRGKETGAIRAVTEIVETHAPGEFSRGHGKPMALTTWQSSLRLGRAVHDALKRIGDGTVVPVVSGLWNAAEREEAQRLVENALASSVVARAKAATERFSELSFALHSEGRLLEGVIDLAFVEDGAWVVVDCKTDAVVGREEMAERALVYQPQLYLYALALEQLTSRPVKDLVLLFVRSRQEVSCPWGDGERASTETLLSWRDHPSTN